MRLTVRIALSVALGLVLLLPLAGLYQAFGWPVYHAWGLMHGSVTSALAATVATSFALLGLVPQLGPSCDCVQRTLSATSLFPVTTVLFLASPAVDGPGVTGLYGWVLVSVFVLFLAVALTARKPFIAHLHLLIPIASEPLAPLLLYMGAEPGFALEVFFMDLADLTLPVAGLSLAACVLARATRWWRGRGSGP